MDFHSLIMFQCQCAPAHCKLSAIHSTSLIVIEKETGAVEMVQRRNQKGDTRNESKILVRKDRTD